jgi:hypothetical protein
MIEPSAVIATGARGSAPAPFAVLRTGRLIQLRVRRLVDVADVGLLEAAVASALQQAGPAATICADYRAASPLPPEVTKAWARAMRNTNGALARSALLIDPGNSLFNLQIERIVKCSANPARRVFPERGEMQRWIAVVLEDREREAVGAFLLG